jgi:hypothetical protein
MWNRRPAEGNVQSQVSYPTRHEVVQQMAPQYRKVSHRQKTRVLNAFVAVTGSSRTYAVQILTHPEALQPSRKPPTSCFLPSRGPASPIPGMESSQSDLRQTTDPLPAHAGRRPGAAWASASDAGVSQATALHESNNR